jgi:hypothetical protein
MTSSSRAKEQYEAHQAELYADNVTVAASIIGDEALRAECLGEALSRLDSIQLGPNDQSTLVPGSAILRGEAALQLDSWIVGPGLGVRQLTRDELLAEKREAIREAIRGHHPLYPMSTVRAAARSVSASFGPQRMVEFMVDCWRTRLLLSIDEFFWAYVTGMRAAAFMLDYDSAEDELREADQALGTRNFTILDRTRSVAALDRRRGRSVQDLRALLERAQASAEAELARLLDQPFAAFLRGVANLRPIYYALRDLWYIAMELTDDQDERDDARANECWVDERQADIGGLLISPSGGLAIADLVEWEHLGPAARRARYSYWLQGRVHLNREVAQMMFERASPLKSAEELKRLADDVQAVISRSLDPGQRVIPDMIRRA